jgi:hypothetical protein
LFFEERVEMFKKEFEMKKVYVDYKPSSNQAFGLRLGSIIKQFSIKKEDSLQILSY